MTEQAATATLSALTPDQSQRIAMTWRFRQRGELIAAERFARLALELAQLGARADVVSMTHEAAEDERRHADLCGSLVDRYLRRPLKPMPLPMGPLGADELSQRDRVLYEMVAFCCVTETLNSALLVETLRVCKEPMIHDTVRAILKDEVRHAKVGWTHLASERGEGHGAFLAAMMPAILVEAGAEEIGVGETVVPPELAAYGELNAETRRQIFTQALTEVIIPGLVALGLDPEPTQEFLADWQVL